MDNLEKEFAVHEAVCAQRYDEICRQLKDGDKRMTKMEYMLYAIMLVVLFGPGVAAEFVKKLLGI
jgi:cell division protein FtsL